MIGTAIQQKYVYLFELDSVRDSDEEIIAGQAAIYDEIVRKGNTVVLTYNQLVDSRAFFSLMTDEVYYRNILQLFEQGCIRISQFGDIRTVAQYILSTVDANKRFIYSALPLKYRQAIFSGIGQKLFFSFICLLATCGVKFAFQDMKHVLDHFMNVGTAVFSIAETILFLLFTEWISNVLAAHCPVFVPLSKALGSMYTLLRDAWHTFCMPRAVSAASPGAEVSEARSQETPIDFITPKELRDYQAYRKRHGGLFAPSDEIPIADTGDRAVVRKLVRSMELYHQEFGMVYQSRYNTFLVDPIAKADGTYYPFERVLPTAGNGVVIAAMRAEKFILLKQYRHALRAEQYSFLFREEGDFVCDTVKVPSVIVQNSPFHQGNFPIKSRTS